MSKGDKQGGDPDWNLKLAKELAEQSLRTGVETLLKLGLSPEEISDRVREIAVQMVQDS
jgi:Holliday junction resolvasome RuvABC DNA-binding subunit